MLTLGTDGGDVGAVGRIVVVLPSSLDSPALALTSKRRTVVYSSEVTTSEEPSPEEAVIPVAGTGGSVV